MALERSQGDAALAGREDGVSGEANHPRVDLPEPPPEEYPRVFGSYVLLAPLARGGMGEVFLGKHGSVAGLEKHCVVKTLRPHLTDDREYTTRFIDEARIVVQLGHRNICHVFDVGTVGERYYLAMEYIAGKDVRSLAHDVGEKGGVMNPGLALHIVCEVLEALDYAHRHVDAATGKPLLLVHRDVSPQNVMVSWEGEVKLIDFGLAASTLKMEQTSPNVVMGKLAYMAPEQVRGERVDGRADLFAAAVLLYELLVGERFYEGKSPYEIWGIAASGGYRPRAWGAVSAELREILDRALAGDVSARFSTCLEFRDALQQYRYAHALHGDSPLLRALMHQIYAKDIDDSRRQLALLTQAKLRDPLAAKSSGVFSVSGETTVSLARAPSRSNKHRVFEPSDIREPTGPTEMVVKAMFGPRRRITRAVAALGVLLLVALGAGTTWLLTRPDPPVLPVLPPTVAIPVPVPVPVPAAIVDAGPAAAADVPDAAAVEAAPDDEPVEAADPKSGRRKKKKALEKDVVDAGRPAVVETAAPALPGFQGVLDKGSWPAVVEVLRGRCASHSCSRELAAHVDDYPKMAPAAFIRWRSDLRACWSKCGLPP